MDVFARTLVAVDGSSPAEVAVRLALQLAGTGRRAIRIVTVLERDTGATQSEAAACREALATAVATARARGTEVETALRNGRAVDQILEEADAWNATCIVIGTHGRGGPARVLFGSCAEGVLHRSARPVLVARAAGDSIERILCAFDGSAAAQRAFDAAVDIAVERNVELHLLSVIQLDDLYATGYERDHFDPDGSIGALYEDARRDLKALGASAANRGVRIAVHVVGGRDVASIIVAGAAQFGCGMVVMGTRGRHGIPAVLGSTATGVTRGASVPVLVLHERRRMRYTPDVQAAILHAH